MEQEVTGASADADRAAGLRPQPAAPSSLSSIPSAMWNLIDAVYKAGVKRGEDEATAYNWGGHARGKFYDELDEAIHEWVNDGVAWGCGEYVDWNDVAAFRASAIEARQGQDAQRLGASHESAVGESRDALIAMVRLDEEIEAEHPGWMTGGNPND